MQDILNKKLLDVINHIDEDSQDMLFLLFKSNLISPDDTVEQALIKIDNSGDEYYEGIMDTVMNSIVGSENNSMPNVTIITNDDDAAHGPRGSLGKFGFVVNEETTPPPPPTGISIQELIDIADEEDADGLNFLVVKHFMKPSADVTDLVIKLNTLLNPQMGNMGAQQDITATEINFDELANTPVGDLLPYQQHEHNVKMRSMYGLKLIEKILGQRNNPEKQKFLNFLSELKGNHDDELISIVENGFKLIHKNKS